MTEKDIHNLIEQQDPETKQRIWTKVLAGLQITLFTYVNKGNGYVKRPITLHDMLVRLSDKTASRRALEHANNHLTSDTTTLDDVGT